MKWKGIVSQLGRASIAARFAAVKTSQATSTHDSPRVHLGRCVESLDLINLALGRGREPVAAVSHRLDRRLRAELLPEPPDAHVDDVRARVEVVAPDIREQPLATHHFALVQNEVVQEAELAVRELGDHVAEASLAACEVERQCPCAHDRPAVARARASELSPDTREKLVERERLRDVVTGAEPETTELCLQVGSGGDDHDRELGPLALKLAQHGKPIALRQQEVQDDKVVVPSNGLLDAGSAVARAVNAEAFCFKATREKGQDPRLVLDDQDAHKSPARGP